MNAASVVALSDVARAKVNLTLRVVGRRVDGYHDLESMVAFADCADRLTLHPGDELSLVTSGPGAQDCGDTADNLVLKATRLLAERVPGLRSGAFVLDKHLPVAAGIGGGSADAAAALRLLARANDISSDDPRLIEAARLTGADVPVCLSSTPCVMTGVGDNLTPLRLARLPAVMVNPRVPVATKDVFSTLGLRAGQLNVGIADVLNSIGWPKNGASASDWIAAVKRGRNDLEAPALKVEPVVGDVLAALAALPGVQLARMSGSGATCFGLFDDLAKAQAAQEQLAALRPEWYFQAAETL